MEEFVVLTHGFKVYAPCSMEIHFSDNFLYCFHTRIKYQNANYSCINLREINLHESFVFSFWTLYLVRVSSFIRYHKMKKVKYSWIIFTSLHTLLGFDWQEYPPAWENRGPAWVSYRLHVWGREHPSGSTHHGPLTEGPVWGHQTGSGLVVKVNIKIKGQRSCYIYGAIKQGLGWFSKKMIKINDQSPC